jgi:HPt (histidine-containing phosphotransfer) domain-containing protein
MKGRRETLVVATAAVLFGVVFGILFLACGQSEDEPSTPRAPSASKVAADRGLNFNETHKHVQGSGENIEDFRQQIIEGFGGKVAEDLKAALGEFEAEQAQLMAKLEAIGGENEKWDAAREELNREAHVLKGGLRKFQKRVNDLL